MVRLGENGAETGGYFISATEQSSVAKLEGTAAWASTSNYLLSFSLQGQSSFPCQDSHRVTILTSTVVLFLTSALSAHHSRAATSLITANFDRRTLIFRLLLHILSHMGFTSFSVQLVDLIYVIECIVDSI